MMRVWLDRAWWQLSHTVFIQPPAQSPYVLRRPELPQNSQVTLATRNFEDAGEQLLVQLQQRAPARPPAVGRPVATQQASGQLLQPWQQELVSGAARGTVVHRRSSGGASARTWHLSPA